MHYYYLYVYDMITTAYMRSFLITYKKYFIPNILNQTI